MGPIWTLERGANLRADGRVDFRVWAPLAKRIALKLWRKGANLSEQIDMQRWDSPVAASREPNVNDPTLSRTTRDKDGAPGYSQDGVWQASAEAAAGDLYQYVLDYPGVGAMSVPDPVSRLLPEGVHGRTEIVDPTRFVWSDAAWRGVPLLETVFYELHVATFTPEGTLDAAISKLDYLRALGITTVEIMPVNAFPGTRNWGYDGVGVYAVQASYGGPEALRRFVDAAHARGLAVVLDVVYNHFGNEGNYLRAFAPFFTHRHTTPWGDAVNFDDVGSAGVRSFFVDNALYWISEYHLDGLRLDAVQMIKDDSPEPIVAEIARNVRALGEELGREVLVIAETDENDPRYGLPQQQGGYGTDAFWSDDFHNGLHVLLTGELDSYYVDYDTIPPAQVLVRALSEGYAFQGEYSKFLGSARGAKPGALPLPANVICIQNHDQIGNRALGERLADLVPHGAQKLLAALLLMAPHTPLIFMGEEYDEHAPFQFFTDFSDPVIQKAVTEGRCNEYPHFDPSMVPDPQSPATFERSRLTWKLDGRHAEMLQWYRALLRLRKQCVTPSERTCKAEWVDSHTLVMRVPASEPRIIVAASFSGEMEWGPDKNFELRLGNSENGFQVRVFQRL
jgi:maltooligosyltrehalose trehalohydrolase